MMKRFLFLLFIPVSLVAQNVQDPVFDSIEKHLPAGWVMTRTENELLIFRTDSVWLCSQNTVNAYYDNRDTVMVNGQPPRSVLAQSQGKKSTALMRFRIDPLWTAQQIKNAQFSNDSIEKIITELPDKIGIERRFLFGQTDRTNAPPDTREKEMIYFLERERLLALKIKMPQYHTKTSSLVPVEYKGSGNYRGYRIVVFPPQGAREISYIQKTLFPQYMQQQ